MKKKPANKKLQRKCNAAKKVLRDGPLWRPTQVMVDGKTVAAYDSGMFVEYIVGPAIGPDDPGYYEIESCRWPPEPLANFLDSIASRIQQGIDECTTKEEQEEFLRKGRVPVYELGGWTSSLCDAWDDQEKLNYAIEGRQIENWVNVAIRQAFLLGESVAKYELRQVFEPQVIRSRIHAEGRVKGNAQKHSQSEERRDRIVAELQRRLASGNRSKEDILREMASETDAEGNPKWGVRLRQMKKFCVGIKRPPKRKSSQ